MKILIAIWNFIKKQKPCYIIIAVLIIILIFVTQCRGGSNVDNQKNKIIYITDTITTVDTIRDTTRIISNVYVPVPGETVYTEVPADIDSAKIAQEYFAMTEVIDTLQNDTSALIIVKDKIYMNNIYSRQYEFVNNRPIQVITNTTITTPIKDCKAFNLGFGIYGGPVFKLADTTLISKGFTTGASVLLTTNRQSSYKINYGFININNTFYQSFQFGIYWNIK